MRESTLTQKFYMYSKGWFCTRAGFKGIRSINNNDEIEEAKKELSCAISKYNDADEDKIIECIGEINYCYKKLDKLYNKAKKDLQIVTSHQ